MRPSVQRSTRACTESGSPHDHPSGVKHHGRFCQTRAGGNEPAQPESGTTAVAELPHPLSDQDSGQPFNPYVAAIRRKAAEKAKELASGPPPFVSIPLLMIWLRAKRTILSVLLYNSYL